LARLVKNKGRRITPLPKHTVFHYDINYDTNIKGDCMMNTIINENLISFKELEIKIYDYICELGREMTQIMLEGYDTELREGRNKKEYRCKGSRSTTIKTVYGEVEYSRNIYQTVTEEGKKAFIYLLDEALAMDKIGMISTNLAEKIAETVTEAPYRVTAEMISSTCGQSISHSGVWNLIQKLGERISEEEKAVVSEMEQDQAKGTKEIPVLFEEMDGVWLRMQGKDHKRMKKQEMKVSVMYEGWEKDGKKNSRLSNKTVLAGMEKSDIFHQKREAQIHRKYNADEIKQRILNGDGGSWIKDPYDPDVIFQLDRFHIYQEIKRKIKDKEAEKRIIELIGQKKIDEMLEFILIYADSVENNDETDKTSSNARKLYEYLNNNKEGLLPYTERGIAIPEAPANVVYKGMGVQENQNCTTITLRMKHRRMRWSPNGANNMSKVLYTKENRELSKTIERYTDGLIFAVQMQEVIKSLSAAKAPKKDGKGNPYVDRIRCHMPLFEGIQTASRKAMKKAFGY